MTETEESFARRRRLMVEEQLEKRGVHDSAVLKAMAEVPRHLFIPEDLWDDAYSDTPLPLGPEQTISQPLVVAEMLQLLELKPQFKVLEIGTGSGYEAALLAKICAEVFTIEIDELLFKWAGIVFQKLGIKNIRQKLGNGYEGWPDASPFDAIVLSAASPYIPQVLLQQLNLNGRCILPLGQERQELTLVSRTPNGFVQNSHGGVRFVMMK
ncbi:MAG: protein-L-isoaspartate(D-aspartate) O-methyltransferase [SAR324 cluster bacterium]|uniref:Protein-L-isoaspartate O-methyltransferase n=1 Tax=SAR324 cluster bacterium TaxID=2024889 RepID=A0A7X9IJC5_9DELT|nr:protein-L-isoaspartate(D-aspartate) O-methyltransferase [SAR324 cluster bacterium]